MKNQITARVIRLTLAMAMVIAIWSTFQARSAESADEKSTMMKQCQEMMNRKQEMRDDIKADNAELTKQLANMNNASKDKKMNQMAVVVTHLEESRISMDARKEKMDEEMMSHMMQHLQMGHESMSQCAMMKSAKDMGTKDMMKDCREMMDQKHKMSDEMKVHNEKLTAQLAKMNSAPKAKKMDLMAAVVTHAVELQITMDARKAKMDEDMMAHMMQHLQMGHESMMMSMKDMDAAHKAHK